MISYKENIAINKILQSQETKINFLINEKNEQQILINKLLPIAEAYFDMSNPAEDIYFRSIADTLIRFHPNSKDFWSTNRKEKLQLANIDFTENISPNNKKPIEKRSFRIYCGEKIHREKLSLELIANNMQCPINELNQYLIGQKPGWSIGKKILLANALKIDFLEIWPNFFERYV